MYKAIFVLMMTSLFLTGCTLMQTQTLTVGSETVQVEVVSTPQMMATGLSGRNSLVADRGMLFLYEEPQIPQFWMKDMNFPIDIVWLRDQRIVGIEQNVPVDDGIVRYAPSSPVDAVLELAAGVAGAYGVRIGDRIEYQR